MNEQQYRTVISWFNARPAAKKALRAVSTGAVAAVYLLYLGLLAWLAWHAMWVPLGVTAVVPAAAFVVGTALRAAINRPRPYTKYALYRCFQKIRPARACPAATASQPRPLQRRCGTCCRRWGQCWRFWPSS